jgi:hypothetical protein
MMHPRLRRLPDPGVVHLRAEVLHERGRQLTELVAADARQQVLGPDLGVHISRSLLQVRYGVLRPPLVDHEVGQRHA